MRKRIASLFLVLALCLSLLPTAALAEEIPETTPGDTIPASESAQKPEVDEAVLYPMQMIGRQYCQMLVPSTI